MIKVRNRFDGTLMIALIFIALVSFATSQALATEPSALIQLKTQEENVSKFETEPDIFIGPQGSSPQAALSGLDGAPGAPGARGSQGIAGEPGEKGEQGIQGVQGEKGEQGIQGVQGEKGEKGETGATGASGASGASGANGAQGPQGSAGANGAIGPMGPIGPAGTFSSAGFIESPACYSTDPKGKVPVGTMLFGTCASLGISGINITVVTKP